MRRDQRQGRATHRQPSFCLSGQSTAARKEATWKEDLVEGSSHWVSEDVTSDLLPSSPPAWPSPPLRVAGLGIVGRQHPGAFQSRASRKRWVAWGVPRREEVGLLTWGMGAGFPHQ